jgi:signal transduction histidine kinase
MRLNRIVTAGFCRCLLPSVIIAAATAQPTAHLPVLTRVEQIRALSAQQASLSYPVRIRGVITMDAPAPDFFVQDSTAGIYVEGSNVATPRVVFGQLVQIEGTTGPGKFAPVISAASVRVLGKGTLPVAKLSSFSHLASGQQDSQWEEVRGIVRSVAIDRTSWREMTLAMRVASEGGEFNLRVPIESEQDFSSWVDSEVLIEGVCGSLYTADRQLSGILFYVPRLSFIKIEAPAPEVSISRLLQFSPGAGARHRVRLRGVVTYQQLGRALFIRVQGKGLRVLTEQATPLNIGDVVDVLGFPATGESAPVLGNAEFHRLAHETAPEPIALDLNSPWEELDGALVRVNAVLLSHELKDDTVRLLLQDRQFIFEASFAGTSARDLVSLPLNSKVEVTGICLVRSGGLWHTPESFRLLLRSGQDVVVLAKPSWWNLRHTLWVLAITVSALLIVLAWVVVLGRRVREQMVTIRQRLQHGAVLEERNRIARELHDTLEQELSGITMQLDLAADCFQQAPGVAKRALESARQMSRRSMIDARRSVWDLRCQLLESGNLSFAIEQIIAPLVSHANVTVELKVQGTQVRLEGPLEMNLLRIAQEAVANAIQHGCVTRIQVELRYETECVGLVISDNGHGFDVGNTLAAGHFGLLDMHERAQAMGSQLTIESEPGRGTTVSVKVHVRRSSGTHDAEVKANPSTSR